MSQTSNQVKNQQKITVSTCMPKLSLNCDELFEINSNLSDQSLIIDKNKNPSQVSESSTIRVDNTVNRNKKTDLTILELNKQVATLQAKISHLEQMKRQKKEIKKLEKKKRKDRKKVLKKALLIGINYIGSPNQLNGCINDSKNLADLLVANRYFKPNEIILMNDHQVGTGLYPSKVNILQQLESLIKFAEQNHSCNVKLFLSYSGHGSYLQDINGDEDDHRDEVICPIDYLQSGYILDDDFNRNFICRLPKNVHLVSLVDACYSGTMFDLRYNYKVDTKDSRITNASCPKLSSHVILISACRDDQTAEEDNKIKKSVSEYQGAMTAAFINNYKHGVTYSELINSMRLWLKQRNYTQVPQLSTGRHILTGGPFMLCEY